MKITFIKAMIVALAVVVAGGCANQTTIDEVRAIAEAAQSTANNAASQASSALSTANQALDTARAAQTAAKAAQDCCNANKTAIDKAFQQIMAK
jgi:hypothetical protein